MARQFFNARFLEMISRRLFVFSCRVFSRRRDSFSPARSFSSSVAVDCSARFLSRPTGCGFFFLDLLETRDKLRGITLSARLVALSLSLSRGFDFSLVLKLIYYPLVPRPWYSPLCAVTLALSNLVNLLYFTNYFPAVRFSLCPLRPRRRHHTTSSRCSTATEPLSRLTGQPVHTLYSSRR